MTAKKSDSEIAASAEEHVTPKDVFAAGEGPADSNGTADGSPTPTDDVDTAAADAPVHSAAADDVALIHSGDVNMTTDPITGHDNRVDGHHVARSLVGRLKVEIDKVKSQAGAMVHDWSGVDDALSTATVNPGLELPHSAGEPASALRDQLA